MENSKLTHHDLCRITAEHFVKSKTVGFYEVQCQSLYEFPDVLIFNSSGRQNLYEIKMSYEDFKADKNKLSRQKPQFGHTRDYVCPKGIIPADEITGG